MHFQTNTYFLAVKFQDGVTVIWSIEGDGGSLPQDAVAGSASNGFKTWTVKRDKGTVLFRSADGFDCAKIYYAA